MPVIINFIVAKLRSFFFGFVIKNLMNAATSAMKKARTSKPAK